jgi:flagellar FliL protein
MAKKPKKAAEDGEAGADAAPKGKKKLMIIVAAAILVVGGAGAFMMMGRGGNGDGKEAAASGHGGGHGGGHGESAKNVGPDGKKPIVFVEMREMLLNLSPDMPQEKAKYAKLRLALELKDSGVEDEVKPLMPRIEDTLQVYMRELRVSDLTGSVGLYRLREELLRRVNVAVYPAKVEAVLFKDVIVQ